MLEARDVWVAPPGAGEDAVRGASLSVGKGEWLAVSGANGSGKTTLLLALAGLWGVRRGSLALDGEPWGVGAPARLRARVAAVMQEPGAQLLCASVRDELEFALLNLGWPRARRRASVERWAAAFRLEALLERAPLALSAGEQQRLLLAAALATEPDLLVLDEPTAHMDADGCARALELVEGERGRRGLAVVWATQQRAEAEPAGCRLHLVEGRLAPAADLSPGPAAAAASPPGAPIARVRVRTAREGCDRAIRVARPLEFDLPACGLVAVTGRNGTGKSVLLAAVSGVAACPQVSVEWAAPPPFPAAYAGQNPDEQVFAETAGEEILFGARRRGAAVADLRPWLERWLGELGYEPAPFLARRTWCMSAGEKRLLTLAGALLAPAGMVALDEPGVGLDGSRAGVVGRWVADRAREVPVLLASHDAAWCASLAARVVPLGVDPVALPSTGSGDSDAGAGRPAAGRIPAAW